MVLDFNSETSIYIQLAEAIEDNILKGIFEEETQVPSTTEISVKFKINPATSRKGMSLLVDEDILYKKRGLGMFVKTGAKEKITEKRRKNFFDNYIFTLLEEAKKLGISKEDIILRIERSI